MGLRFPLRFTNVVAYFTTEMSTVTCPPAHLLGFFEMLRFDEWRIVSGRDPQEWMQRVRQLAARAWEIALTRFGDFSERRELQAILADEQSLISIDDAFAGHIDILRSLKTELGSFDLFALGVAAQEHSIDVGERLAAWARDVRFARVLFLIPDHEEEIRRNLDFYNPFPGASDICRYPERWPGILLWEPRRTSVFLPLGVAANHLPAIMQAPDLPRRLRDLKHDIADQLPKEQGVRLLHLSDLHCGRRYTAKKEAYLLAFINDELREKYDKIIITGDCFDSPWVWKWREFENFRQSLRMLTEHDPIIVPGNHDIRVRGNAIFRIGSYFRPVSELEWKDVDPDPHLRCLFFCFNSSKSGNFARGEVLSDDLTDAATEYHILAGRNKDLPNWLRVAIVHHHPFEFNAAAEGWTAKMLKTLHIPEGKLVDMNHSQRFVKWCADRGVQLILFGHRHVQRKITQRVAVRDGATVEVTAVGCGTSLGAERLPLSFNIVSWDPVGQRWSAKFYLDEEGGGFKEVRAVSLEIDPLSRNLAATA